MNTLYLKTSHYSQRSGVKEGELDSVNNDFHDCKGIGKGPVFLIGSGSSATDFPIREMSCIPMITMNGAISMFTDAGVRPFFYVCSDKDFCKQQPELFSAAMRDSENVALWDDQLRDLVQIPWGRAYPLKKAERASPLSILIRDAAIVRKHSLFSRRSRDIGFSKDMTLGFFDARTVMYLAIQMAYHLGFDKVFLVGFDLNQTAGRFYETPGCICSPCGLDQHYHSRILPSLELMSKYVMDENFQVFNLSSVSRVPEDIIPRLTIDEVRALLGITGFVH
ncbi:lipopolysaccharide biosynthesis protein [Pseudomonas californiensis]|uniref:lipopolysaccharide biosynthesis protein n=1 Tax=Pseudomonas californiensis TaxID=2829823 RepID=UPI001E2AF3A6|nr:lipopolysaccharide biosynthesis protein [Pseudomonas californiensis]